MNEEIARAIVEEWETMQRLIRPGGSYNGDVLKITAAILTLAYEARVNGAGLQRAVDRLS